LGEDSYVARVSEAGVNLQPQLQAAFELRKAGEWTEDSFKTVRLFLEEEYNVAPEQHVGDATPTFSPWAPTVQARPLPPGWEFKNGQLVEVDPEASRKAGMTGRVKASEVANTSTRVQVSADPVRSEGGRFLPHTAELWYYTPDEGKVKRQVFASATDAIARAWARANQLQHSWNKLGVKDACVWIKYRVGEMKGNRWVFLSDAKGMLAMPQDVVRLHSQAKAWGIKAKVGERTSKTKIKHVQLMLEQNRPFVGVLRAAINQVDVPNVEPADPNEIVYSIAYQSGATRSATITPLSDDLDEEGNVVLAGHRKRAYRLLLETPSSGSDSPRTIKYVVYGEDMPQVYVVGRDQAILWAEETKGDDEVLAQLEEDLDEGRISDEEYSLAKVKRLNEIDPPEPKRRGPTMHVQSTRVDYVRGRVNWQRARNSGGPGTRWVASITGGSNWEASVAQMFGL
jgi:hypothetical protein